MLHPFLFIGVGGSGGKTLWTIRADLQRRLSEAGFDDRWWPACWQMLHVDVPTTADGTDPDLPAQLAERDYVGMVQRGVNYRAIDDALTSAGRADEAVLRNLLGWRPEPARVTVPVARGAGQYRALGRAITLAGISSLAEALRRSLNQLHGADMSGDLAEVSRRFGAPVLDRAPTPEVVVIASLAGGSGSGAFLDVCDVLRAVGGGAGYTDESFGVLYASDVFNHLDPESRKGVHGNALAALCELMSGFWDTQPATSDFAVISARGLNVGAPQRRGPRFPFVVGTKNDRVGFGHQNDVYKAMGKALAAWVVSEHLQQELKSYIAGNWAMSATVADNLRLCTGEQEQPLSSMGFARVSLGRDNFATYASERLARGAVNVALRQHLVNRAPDADANHEVAIEESVNAGFSTFLESSGLNERGEQQNQVLDALEPPDLDEQLAATADSIRTQVLAGHAKPRIARDWQRDVLDYLRNGQQVFFDQQAAARLDQAARWVPTIQDRVIHLVARTMSERGGPVTVRLLGRLRDEVQFAIDSLRDEESTRRHWAGRLEELVSAELPPVKDAYGPDHPAIEAAVRKGVDCFEWAAQADLRQLAVELLTDLVANFLEPLQVAVRGGLDLLASREKGTGVQPSIVEGWPKADVVPRRLQPAGNEFLLEPVESYPATFADAIVRSASVKDPGGAESEYVRHALVGSSSTRRDEQSLVTEHTRWVPGVGALYSRLGTAARGQFQLTLDPADVLARARALVEDRDSPIGVLVSESLQDYLDERTVDPAQLDARANRFRDAFVQALETSAPLVNIDPQVLMRVHGTDRPAVSQFYTEIPFPEGSRGYEIVRKVLESSGRWDGNATSAFSEGRQSRIDVFSILRGVYNPVVFESLMGPIADEWSKRRHNPDLRGGFWRWRRARPLGTFLPIAPGVRAAMVRGWFTARLLGDLEFDEVVRERMGIWHPGRKKIVSFPDPLLGPPVFEEYERLPAVLESLPVALLEYAERGPAGDEALAPYWRLRELGTDGRGAENAYEAVNVELDAWIRLGTTTGAPAGPRQKLAGPAGSDADAAEARKSACLASLQNWRNRYGELIDRRIELDEFFSIARVVELGDEVPRAIEELERSVGKLQAAGSEDDF